MSQWPWPFHSAAMRYDDLPLKAVGGILVFASISAGCPPYGAGLFAAFVRSNHYGFCYTGSDHPNCHQHCDAAAFPDSFGDFDREFIQG